MLCRMCWPNHLWCWHCCLSHRSRRCRICCWKWLHSQFLLSPIVLPARLWWWMTGMMWRPDTVSHHSYRWQWCLRHRTWHTWCCYHFSLLWCVGRGHWVPLLSRNHSQRMSLLMCLNCLQSQLPIPLRCSHHNRTVHRRWQIHCHYYMPLLSDRIQRWWQHCQGLLKSQMTILLNLLLSPGWTVNRFQSRQRYMSWIEDMKMNWILH